MSAPQYDPIFFSFNTCIYHTVCSEQHMAQNWNSTFVCNC